jgi:hypothetical protein
LGRPHFDAELLRYKFIRSVPIPRPL